MQAQYGYWDADANQGGIYAPTTENALIGPPGADYLAMGAFSGTAGLPTSIASLSDFWAYENAVLQKAAAGSEVSSEALKVRIINVTTAYLVVGGYGNDVITADDSAFSGSGVYGSGTLMGGDGADTLDAAFGNDLLVGGTGADKLLGEEGNDILRPGTGDATIMGGVGSDTLDLSDQTSAATVNIPQGGLQTVSGYQMYVLQMEDVIGTDGDDSLVGGSEANHFQGGDGNDTLVSGGGQDTLEGEGGNDLIRASAGDQTLSGGAGVDTVSYADLTQGVLVSLALQGASQSTTVGLETLSSIENLTGTAYADQLTGDIFNNSLVSGGGADSLSGGSGSDTLVGATGDQTLLGGVGNDVFVVGSGGDDRMDGGDGLDTVSYAGAQVGVSVIVNGADQETGVGMQSLSHIENLVGSGFDDTLTGDFGSNVLNGGLGGDVLLAGGGDDTVAGGDGDDLVRAGAGQQVLDGGAGTDTLSYADLSQGVSVSLAVQDGTTLQATGVGAQVLSGFENLTGTGQADSLTGDTDANTIQGGGGADTIDGGGGDDSLAGGGGVNTVSYLSATSGVTVNLNQQGSAQTTGVGSQTLSGFTNILGSAQNDVLTGDAADNTIMSGGGLDTLDGAGGSNTVSFAGSADPISIYLGTGDYKLNGVGAAGSVASFTTVIGSGGGDTISGSAGNESLVGGGGDDQFGVSEGADTFDGGAGSDTISFFAQPDSVVLDLTKEGVAQATSMGSVTVTSVENVYGGANDDRLTGGGEANLFYAGDGDDVLVSGGGQDTLSGEAGDDTILAGAGDQHLYGYTSFGTSNDTDTVSYEKANTYVTVSLALQDQDQNTNIGMQYLSGFENLRGSTQDDSLYGDDNANQIDGYGGDNYISAAGGNDTVFASVGNDIIDGGDGVDTLSFEHSAVGVTFDLSVTGAQSTDGGTYRVSNVENLVGGAGADALTGDASANVLDGGAGADTLNGGGGNDTLMGSGPGDHLNGGAGLDLASYVGATAGVNVDLNDASHLQNIEALQGSNFADTLAGGASQTVNGGAGDDLVRLTEGVTADGGDGVDTADFSRFSDGLNVTLAGSASETEDGVTTTFNHFESAVLTQYNDKVSIYSNDWSVSAGAGSDLLQLYSGGHVALDGGDGDDKFLLYSGNAEVSVNGGLGDDVAQLFGHSDVTVDGGVGADGLQVFTSAGSFNMSGGEGDDYVSVFTGGSDIVMNGGVGDDVVTLFDGGSDITLNGGDGVDTLTTYDSSNLTVDLSWSVVQDTGQGLMVLNSVENVYGYAGDDHLAGSAADNALVGASGDDTIVGGSGGDDTLNGSDGTDTLTYANATSRVAADLHYGLAQVGGSTEHIYGFDVLIGSDFDDDLAAAATIQAGGGGDLVHGGYAVSVNLDGGAGTDTLTYADATTGVSVSLGRQGKVQSTGVADQTLNGFENLTGSLHNDRLSGDSGANVVNGGDGADTILPTGGADTLDGGAGIDTLDLSRLSNGATVDLHDGTLQSPGVMAGISGFETFIGTGYGDSFADAAGDQSYLAGAGDDYFLVVGGSDTFDGGAGNDSLNFVNVANGVTVNLADRHAQDTGVGMETIRHVETLYGSIYSDHLTGDSGANVIGGGGGIGLQGPDTINGGGGDDTLYGAGSGDTVSYAGARRGVQVVLYNQGSHQQTGVGDQYLQGFSNIEGSSRSDILVGDQNANLLSGGGGRDIIVATPGQDSYDGGAGLDLLIYQGSGPVTVDFVNGVVHVDGFNQMITSIEGVLGPNSGSLYLDDDTFRAILGGDGRDTVVAGKGDDTYNGGDGVDLLDLSAGNGVTVDLATNQAQDTGLGSKVIIGFEQVIGSAGNDTLLGSSLANRLEGDGGDDVINGRGGNDTLKGGDGGESTVSYAGAGTGVHVSLSLQGADQDTGVGQQLLNNFNTLVGTSYDDTLGGAGRAEKLDGGRGDDHLSSLGGADTLVGGAGKDVLDGGSGSDTLVSLGDGDTLSGGAQTDTFMFSGLQSKAAATITDLLAADTIDLTGAETATGLTFTQVTQFHHAAGEFLLSYNQAGNSTTVRFDLDGDGKADHLITLAGGDFTGFSHFAL